MPEEGEPLPPHLHPGALCVPGAVLLGVVRDLIPAQVVAVCVVTGDPEHTTLAHPQLPELGAVLPHIELDVRVANGAGRDRKLDFVLCHAISPWRPLEG